MSRLTNKNSIFFGGRISGKNIFKQMYDKLGKLEDLEQELGCPLEVVFKLRTEESIIVKGYGSEFETWETDDFQVVWVKKPYIIIFDNYGMPIRDYKIKDYGKTWWLKGDKRK